MQRRLRRATEEESPWELSFPAWHVVACRCCAVTAVACFLPWVADMPPRLSHRDEGYLWEESQHGSLCLCDMRWCLLEKVGGTT